MLLTTLLLRKATINSQILLFVIEEQRHVELLWEMLERILILADLVAMPKKTTRCIHE